MGFTKAQREAIKHDGHLLIVAGPGSGKTTTFVAKAQHILQDPKRSLLMTTFTRHGANEMRGRLKDALEKAGIPMPEPRRLVVATLHKVAIQHLRLSVPDLDVLSPAHQKTLLDDTIQSLVTSHAEAEQVRKEFEAYMHTIDRESLAISAVGLQVIERYTERLLSCGQTDLPTVMRDCAIKVHAGEIPPMHYTDILVDEGQDTDQLQQLWIFAHARQGATVTIVGDDDQSIYEWRNALGFSGMREFLNRFDAHRIELGDNFRCKQEILDPAAKLISMNEARLHKRLVARRGSGGAIAALRTASQTHQGDFVASFISNTLEIHQHSAILARNNRSLDIVEGHLRMADVPYRRLGKSIWDNEHVAALTSFLSSLVDGNPIGVLSYLKYMEFTGNTIDELLFHCAGDASTFLDGVVPPLSSASEREMIALVNEAEKFTAWRRGLRDDTPGGPMYDMVVWDVCRIFKTHFVSESAAKIIEICSGILMERAGLMGVKAFVRVPAKHQAGSDALTLMTMHSAKGLEFETVHILDALSSEYDTEVDVESERRLMYVALTRAKNRCAVWYHGQPHSTIAEAGLSTLLSPQELAMHFRT